MKKEELKKLIKPLIKECLTEVLIEEGFAKMLSESVLTQQSVEQPKILQQLKTDSAQQSKQTLAEAKKKMLQEIGMNGFDAFAGTQPITEAGNPSIPTVAVTGLRPDDPGIDISRFMSGKLKATFNALNGKKVKE